jgi:adenylate cyclase
MMSDLRGFTAMSEVQGAEQIVSMLNNYLGKMTDIIVRHGGTIDEFIGDGILVFFGAPQRREDDASRAVACAIEMQLAMAEINAWNRDHGLPDVHMGIGLNTGEVIVGNIGSQKRAKYGAVGSHVNLTGRVESYTVGGQILISETTRQAITAPLEIASEMRVEPKGVKTPISIFEITGIGAPYDLRLASNEAKLTPLQTPLSASFVLLDGKHATGEESGGQLIQLSAQEAEFATSRLPEPLTNLRLRLDSHPDQDLHAKVLARHAMTPGAVVLRFTAVPMPVASHFASLLG